MRDMRNIILAASLGLLLSAQAWAASPPSPNLGEPFWTPAPLQPRPVPPLPYCVKMLNESMADLLMREWNCAPGR